MHPTRFSSLPQKITVFLLLPLFVFLLGGCLYLHPYSHLEEKALQETKGKGSPTDSFVSPRGKRQSARNVSSYVSTLMQRLQSQSTLTLNNCIALAFAYNDQLAGAGEDYFQALLQKEKAISAVLPTLDYQWQFFQQQKLPASVNASFSPLTRTNSEIQIRQPLFSGLRDIAGLRAASDNIRAHRALLVHKKTQIRLLVAQTFYTLLKTQKEISILQSSLSARDQRLRDMKERRKAGLVRDTDVLLIQTQVASDQTLLTQDQNNLRIAQVHLENLMGMSLHNKPLQDTPLPQVPVESLDLALQRAYAQRQDLQALQAVRKEAHEKYKAVVGEFLPTISLVGNRYFQRSGYQRGINWDGYITFEFPLFEGTLRHAELAEALSQERQARDNYQALKKQVTEDVTTTYYQLETTHTVLAQLKEEVDYAQKNYHLLYEEYKQAIATNLEVLFADIALQNARIQWQEELYNRKIAVVQLQAAMESFP